MFINKDILTELQDLDEQRARCEAAVQTNGTYSTESLKGFVVYIDENFDKTLLATKYHDLKHKAACAKLKLINERIKFLTKQLK